MPRQFRLVVRPVSEFDVPMIERLVALGDAARDTLGMLPPAAYVDAAARGCLLVAQAEGEPAGYVLYRRPRSEVALTHVCVAEKYRNHGVARALVDEVSSRNQSRQGIRAKCRDDYQISSFWRSLGFDKLSVTHGRGADRAAMTVWWRDHGHPHLFRPPEVEQPVILSIAIDTNILMDLHTRKDRPEAVRSQSLLAPDLDGRMEITVPYGLEVDLANQADDRRRLLVEAAEAYDRPTSDPVRAGSLFDTLLAAVQQRIPTFPGRLSDEGDLWQVAHAAAAGLKVLVTWDDRLRTVIGPIVSTIDRPEFVGFRIIDPDHLVVHLDELAHAVAYRPCSLEGSQFSTALVGTDSEADLLTFLNYAAGETKVQLRTRLRDLARCGRSRVIIRDVRGDPTEVHPEWWTGAYEGSGSRSE